jgi:hypothetical protein
MWRSARILLALVILTLAAASTAQAEKRIALLIGNEGYPSEIGRLANPHNDVALLEQTLKGLGFEVVSVHDAGLGALTTAINAYARRIQSAGPSAIGFFYYSGHGASDGGTNYLIPVDVKSQETGELWDQSLRLTEITHKLKAEAGNATHFVVFDACRNTLRLTQPGSRAVVQSKGFVPVAQENGMLIAYATAEGELASDIGSGAGPYAKVLAEEVIKPGIEAVAMFRVVQRRVRATIQQEPYLGFSALGDVYLAGRDAKPSEPAPTQARLSEAAEAWDRAKDTTNIAILDTFIARFKDTFFAELARARIDQLKKQQLAVVGSPKSDEQVGPAKETPRGWLGVKIQNIDEEKAVSLGLSEPKGALVNEVIAPGPAAEAGLKAGDAILAVNGTRVANSRDVARQIAAFQPNTKVDVLIWREQREQTIAVKLAAAAHALAPPPATATPSIAPPAINAPACKTVKEYGECRARPECDWVAESRDAQGQVKAKAYCRHKPPSAARPGIGQP